MEDKFNYAAVGAFVLALAAALVVGVLWLVAGVSGKKQFDPYQSIVEESVAGLNVDAPVKYLGVDVGKVSRIGIDPQNTRRVRLLYQIEHGTPIRQDTEAMLKTQGLTGIAYVELSSGSAGSPALVATGDGEVPTIRTKASLSARLENVATAVLGNIDRVSTNLNAIFDADNRIALKQTLADTAALMHTLAQERQALRAAIDDAARTARNTARTSARLGPVIERLGPAVERVAAGADAIGQTARDVSQASASAGHTFDAAAGGVQQLRSEALPDLAAALADVQQLTTSLRRLAEQTERSPGSLLTGRPVRPLGPGETTSNAGARP